MYISCASDNVIRPHGNPIKIGGEKTSHEKKNRCEAITLHLEVFHMSVVCFPNHSVRTETTQAADNVIVRNVLTVVMTGDTFILKSTSAPVKY